MTNTTNGHPPAPARTSPFRAAPLPASPGAPDSWPDRASRLRDQADALGTLIREDLSRGRALVFLLCAGLVTLTAGLVPAMVIDAAGSETGDSTDVAVATALGVVLLAVPALLGLLPCLIVAGLFAWVPVKKYAVRYRWSSRERVIRDRAHRRESHHAQLDSAASSPTPPSRDRQGCP
ncbi:hypothetical protein [Streptomyces ochraceiscleroticus]|uniref:Uncharacterized protein n=1 Tax=Streptomyces ochraceiscleroticus TaxID=47761 RepID=A0ABW1MDH4_9ACTN|nr:hypothetical protein [Streptomyces ochraceiscleroticus]